MGTGNISFRLALWSNSIIDRSTTQQLQVRHASNISKVPVRLLLFEHTRTRHTDNSRMSILAHLQPVTKPGTIRFMVYDSVLRESLRVRLRLRKRMSKGGRKEGTGEDAREEIGVSNRVESRPYEPIWRLDVRTGEICLRALRDALSVGEF